MKLNKILLLVAMVLALPLIVALFVQKDYEVQRQIVIDKPVDTVFEYIKYLKNQDTYSKWNTLDPKMKKTYSGEDGTVGFIAAWESQDPNVGSGEQEIVKITPGKRIDTRLRFKEPFEAEDDAYMTTESAGSGSTRVTWGFKGSFPYPLNLMGLFMDMDKELGGDLREGLEHLKEELEKQ